MTDRHDDLQAADRRLRDALRALPAPQAGEGFTEEVLARLDLRAARPAVAARPRRLRRLALTAAAVAALAVAVADDRLWPSGRWLWLGGDLGTAGTQSEASSEASGTASGASREARPSGADAGPGKAASGSEASRGAEGRAIRSGGTAADGDATSDSRSRGTEAVHTGVGDRAGGDGSGPAPGRLGRGRSEDAGPAAGDRDPVRSGEGSQPAEERPAVRPGGASARIAAPDRLAARPRPADATFLVDHAVPRRWTASDLTGAEAAARLALLRDERERLLVDLRALRAAVPPEEPAGLLLAGGESVDVVLGLGSGTARPVSQRPDASPVLPAALQRDDRPPRPY